MCTILQLLHISVYCINANAFLCCAVGSRHSPGVWLMVKEGQSRERESVNIPYIYLLLILPLPLHWLYQENSGQWPLCSGVLSLSSALRKRSQMYCAAPARAEVERRRLAWRETPVRGRGVCCAVRRQVWTPPRAAPPTLCRQHRIQEDMAQLLLMCSAPG